ncbi:DUF2937 family protein [Bradyrhizobium sp. 956_D2_N1_5]|uniref:DUF2937 family protein n=1 Tax=unclassified Bradyrhizobium TaxID=2631580 RepID=UPI003F207D8A
MLSPPFRAILIGQAPEFAQQYAQRIGGAIEELQRIVDHFDDDSRRSGYDRQGALALMGRNSEQLVRDQGTRISETIDRLAHLRAQHIAMSARGAFTRIIALATGADREIAARTWRDFEFALPLSMDAILFTLLGFIASLGFTWAVAFGFTRMQEA